MSFLASSQTTKEKIIQFNLDLPLEKAQTIPSSWYFDQDVAELERKNVFSRSWQMVGRSDQVALPGSFLTADIAGEPVLVVRDEEGILRAFSNVCRHRAARVMEQECGQAQRLRCRYHGWTYDLTGKLKGTPEFAGVENFAKEDNGLPPLQVVESKPFIFVNLLVNPTEGEDSHSLLQNFQEQSQALSIDKLQFFDRREYTINCNWKVFVDNFLDGGYHVNTVHPGLAGVIDYSGYHSKLHSKSNVQISPFRSSEKQKGEAATTSVRSGDYAYYWWLFPNFMVNLYSGVMDTNLVLPLGVDRCRVIFDFYFPTEQVEGKQDHIKKSIDVSHQIQQEDIDICEEVQRGLQSRSFDTGRFSLKREATGYHFHQILAQYLKT